MPLPEGQRNRAAAVGQPLLVGDALGAVQMPERRVGHRRPEEFRLHRFDVPLLDPALGQLGKQAAGGVQMAGDDDRLVGRAARFGERDDVGVERAQGGGVALGAEVPEIGATQKRHGDGERGDGPVRVVQGNEHGSAIDGTVRRLRKAAHDVHAERSGEALGGVETLRGVVIAAHDDDVQARQTAGARAQEVVVQPLRPGARVGVVEDVAADDQSVDPLGFERVEEPVEEGAVLVVPGHVVEAMPEVPVRRVKEAEHAGQRPVDSSRSRSASWMRPFEATTPTNLGNS